MINAATLNTQPAYVPKGKHVSRGPLRAVCLSSGRLGAAISKCSLTGIGRKRLMPFPEPAVGVDLLRISGVDPYATVVVGSRTGAPTLGAGGCPTAFAVALSPAAIITFPVPATSNVACGFPALRSPVCFSGRGLWDLSDRAGFPQSPKQTAAYSTSLSLSSLRHSAYLPVLVLQITGRVLSVRPCLPYDQKNYKQQGRFAPRTLLRLIATSDPSDSLSPSVRFPGVPGYTAYLAPLISDRDEEGLSSCSARPCHHAVDNHPAGVSHSMSLFAMVHVAFAVVTAGSASRAESFEATSRSLALRPGDSPPSLRWRCR